ncbi:unnamed protein product [Gordionus sp. m RMFG-2023]|uniref:uncharacterized protein LOC135929415 n=1 Tax=Gordionus sp. m RMFG-2023 TaxID=3053472 RepID=UPI0030E57A60
MTSEIQNLWKTYLYTLQLQAPKPKIISCQTLAIDKPNYYELEFHGKLSRNDANKLLCLNGEGSYLVRESERFPGTYTLCLRYDSVDRHYKLYFDGARHFVRPDKRVRSLRTLVADGLVTMHVESRARSYLNVSSLLVNQVMSRDGDVTMMGGKMDVSEVITKNGFNNESRMKGESYNENKYMMNPNHQSSKIVTKHLQGISSIHASDTHLYANDLCNIKAESFDKPGYEIRSIHHGISLPLKSCDRDLKDGGEKDGRLYENINHNVCTKGEIHGKNGIVNRLYDKDGTHKANQIRDNFAVVNNNIVHTYHLYDKRVTIPITNNWTQKSPLKLDVKNCNNTLPCNDIHNHDESRHSKARKYKNELISLPIYENLQDVSDEKVVLRKGPSIRHKDSLPTRISDTRISGNSIFRNSTPVGTSSLRLVKPSSFGIAGVEPSSTQHYSTPLKLSTKQSNPRRVRTSAIVDIFNTRYNRNAVYPLPIHKDYEYENFGHFKNFVNNGSKINVITYNEHCDKSSIYSDHYHSSGDNTCQFKESLLDDKNKNLDSNTKNRIASGHYYSPKQETAKSKYAFSDKSDYVAVKNEVKTNALIPRDDLQNPANLQNQVEYSPCLRPSSLRHSMASSPLAPSKSHGDVTFKDFYTKVNLKNVANQGTVDNGDSSYTIITLKPESPVSSSSNTLHSSISEEDTESNALFGTSSQPKMHHFKVRTFKSLKWCDVCGDFMWGLINQGLKCRDCGLAAHSKCAKQCDDSSSTHTCDLKTCLWVKNRVFGVDLSAHLNHSFDASIKGGTSGTAKNAKKKQNKGKIRDDNREQSSKNGKNIAINGKSCNDSIITDDANTRSYEGDVKPPLILSICCNLIEKNGMHSEGLYRIPGYSEDVETLRQKFDNGEIRDENYPHELFKDINVVASVLKLYLRLLPIPLITFDTYNLFLDTLNIENIDEAVLALRKATQKLPSPHYNTLKYLINHLKRVSDHQSENLMSCSNLAMVFAPNILKNGDPTITPSLLVQTVGISNSAEVSKNNVRVNDKATNLISNEKFMKDSYSAVKLEGRVVENLIKHCQEIFFYPQN